MGIDIRFLTNWSKVKLIEDIEIRKIAIGHKIGTSRNLWPMVNKNAPVLNNYYVHSFKIVGYIPTFDGYEDIVIRVIYKHV